MDIREFSVNQASVLIEPFTRATVSTIEMMCSTQIEVLQPVVKNDTPFPGVISGTIGFSGPKLSGSLILSFDEPSILAMISRMLMDDFKQVSGEVSDAVGEMTNIILGAAKRDLASVGYLFDMAQPIVVCGTNLTLNQVSNNPVICIPFRTAEGQFRIELSVS
jgi:chemotaxis protein CheX